MVRERVSVGEPAGDGGIQGVAVGALKHSEHGGLGRGEGTGWFADRSAQRFEDVGRRVGGPLGHGGQRSRTRKHRARGQGEDEGQRVAPALSASGIRRGGQALQ